MLLHQRAELNKCRRTHSLYEKAEEAVQEIFKERRAKQISMKDLTEAVKDRASVGDTNAQTSDRILVNHLHIPYLDT